MVKRVHFPRYSRNVAMSPDPSGKLGYSPRIQASVKHNSYVRAKTSRICDAIITIKPRRRGNKSSPNGDNYTISRAGQDHKWTRSRATRLAAHELEHVDLSFGGIPQSTCQRCWYASRSAQCSRVCLNGPPRWWRQGTSYLPAKVSLDVMPGSPSRPHCAWEHLIYNSL